MGSSTATSKYAVPMESNPARIFATKTVANAKTSRGVTLGATKRRKSDITFAITIETQSRLEIGGPLLDFDFSAVKPRHLVRVVYINIFESQQRFLLIDFT